MYPSRRIPIIPQCHYIIKSFTMNQEPHIIRPEDWTGCQAVPGVYQQQRPSVLVTCARSCIAIQVDIAPIQGCFILQASACILNDDNTSHSLAGVGHHQGIEFDRYYFEFKPLLAGTYSCKISYNICHTESLANYALASVFHFTALPCRDIMRDGECSDQELQ